MKKITILLVLVLSFSFSSCEKDDICDPNTPTTPRLVISFYDYTNSTLPKNVTNLKVIADGMTEAVIFKGSDIANGNSISIPLKTTENTTSYSFTLNSGNANPILVNEDKIKFDYTRKEVYVSRACGYKTLFTLDPITPYTHTDAAVPDLLWMKHISVETNNIDNENETHIKIFF